MGERKKVTIYDVATACGVSPSTVSRVFSSPGRVSPATAEKVHQAAHDLGFQVAGSSYWEDETHRTLGFLMPQLENPVYIDILNGMQEVAAENNYSIVVINSPDTAEAEKAAIDTALPILDGIAFPVSKLSTAQLRHFERIKPVVMLNRYATAHTCVVADVRNGINQLCDYLYSLGHREILYIAGPETSWANAIRWRALQHETQQRGMALRLVRDAIPGIEGGRDVAARWKPGDPRAVVAFNDLIGVGFLREIQTRGFDVPGDVSVVGIDNSVVSTITTPGLTSLSSGGAEIGRKAAQSLLWQITHRWVRDRKNFLVPVELVVRGSTGPAPL